MMRGKIGKTASRCAVAAFMALVCTAWADTYRCLSYNVSGAGGSCTTQPSLVLASDGTYAFSSETGTYSATASTVFFSGMQAWGSQATRLDNQLQFEFALGGDSYTITYYCTDCTSTTDPGTGSGTSPGTDSRFSAAVSGAAGQQRLDIAIRPEVADYFQPGNLYVAALTPWGLIFARATEFYPFTSEPKTFEVVSYANGPLPELQQRELEPTMTFSIPIGDAAVLAGCAIYVGYGLSEADMMQNAKYAVALQFN